MADPAPPLEDHVMPDRPPSPLELASIPWFVRYMRLQNDGLVPTVTPREFMPKREEMIEFLGPKTPSGYTFDNQDNEEYEVYVQELYTRVLQLNWPISHVIPVHFARGLVAEAKGTEINWAVFAYKMTHPHQSRSGIPRVLPQYTDIQEPLAPLVKVLPFPDDQVRLSSFSLFLHCSNSADFILLLHFCKPFVVIFVLYMSFLDSPGHITLFEHVTVHVSADFPCNLETLF